jgi:hypothetical protein
MTGHSHFRCPNKQSAFPVSAAASVCARRSWRDVARTSCARHNEPSLHLAEEKMTGSRAPPCSQNEKYIMNLAANSVNKA